MKIIPAILENDLEIIKNKINYYSSLKQKYNLDFNLIQIDFCDREFVENKNWLPQNAIELKSLLDLTKDFNIEIHLMCKDTRKYFDICKESGVKNIIVHIDELLEKNEQELLKIKEDSIENNINLGICSKLSFMKENQDKVLSFIGNIKADFSMNKLYVQVMGIEDIGKQGSPFVIDSVAIVQSIRDLFTEEELAINVDGSINEQTFKLFKNAGANSLVVGSYFSKAESEEQLIERYNNLKS